MADEIVLKEGKTLQGKIVAEDDQEYTLRLGSNMVLRVAKDKVSKVFRTPVPVDTRAKVRLAPISASSSPVPTQKSTSTAVESSGKLPNPPAQPLLSQPKSGTEINTRKKETVTINQTRVTQAKPVKQADPSAIQTAWTVSWNGEPVKESEQFKWKWAVVEATVTTTLPSWNPGAPPSSDEAKKWNDFMAKSQTFAAGRADVYQTSLESFSEEITLLRSKDEKSLRDETSRLFGQMKDRAEKKRQGYERHEKNLFDMLEK